MNIYYILRYEYKDGIQIGNPVLILTCEEDECAGFIKRDDIRILKEQLGDNYYIEEELEEVRSLDNTHIFKWEILNNIDGVNLA